MTMGRGIKSKIRTVFNKMSLARKFSSAVILLIFAIMIIVNALIITYQRSSLRAEMENNHRVLAQKLAKDVVEPLIFMDPLRLDELVRTTAQTPSCSYAGIADKDKRIVAHTNRKLLGSTLPEEGPRQTVSIAAAGEEYSPGVSGNSMREIKVPVKAGYEVVGTVFVGFSRDAVDSAIENNLQGLKKYILLISFLVMLAGIWGSIVLARLLTTPMKKLKDKMELLQAGNLDVEVTNESLVDCWEVLGCDAEGCPAYGKKRCWTFSGTRCFGKVQGNEYDKIVECRNCVVYRESCGDEIGELIEVFNHMTKKLRDNINDLEEINKEKTRLEKFSALGEMSMTLAHEIKNPLNAIRGAVSYLTDNFEGEVLREFLSVIEEETVRLNEIVTSFLRFSRPAPLKLAVSDMNSAVRKTVELVRQEATENNVEVVMELDERITPFKFDEQQLRQALLNILVNAIDATKEGDTIKIATKAFDSRVCIMIEDTGAGMSKDMVAEIFKPFFTTKTRGSGLGLACVERIVKDHRGDISVRSEIGGGTEFVITLQSTG